MNFASWSHIAKSPMAFVVAHDTLHLRFQAEKNSLQSVKVIAGDPFYYDREGDDYVWVPSSLDVPMQLEHATPLHDVYHVSIQAPYLRIKYAFIVDDRYLFGAREIIDLESQPHLKTNLFNYFNFPFLLEKDRYVAPSWASNQIWYSIFPARFAKSDTPLVDSPLKDWDDHQDISNKDDFGGDLRGLIKRLPYIAQMGFTGLYLTSIFKAISHHQYDTLDYYEVDPKFGTNEDLKILVKEAHQLGLKVMLDAVFNHCGVFHPFFLDVIEKGKDSPYYSGFYILDDTKPVLPFSVNELKMLPFSEIRKKLTPKALNYRTFGFTPFMPKINLEDPFMRQYFLEVAKHYIDVYDIDGWRLDVSNEVSHDFWRAFRQTVKQAKQDAYIVGENWDESNAWLNGDQYDAVMNYGALYPLWQTFANVSGMPKYTKSMLIESLGKHLTTYPHPVLEHQYNLLDSHDTSRFLTLCEGDLDRFRQGYVMLYLLPGSPSVFYGDEVGMMGGHDPDNRRPMRWNLEDQNLDIQHFFKTLNHLRLNDARLREVSLSFLESSHDDCLIVQKGSLVAVFNLSDTALTVPKDVIKTYSKVVLSHHFDTHTLLRYGFVLLSS